MDQPEGNTPLSQEEVALIADFRRCSPRRQDAILRITKKFADLEWPASLIRIIPTNILPFRRRKDD